MHLSKCYSLITKNQKVGNYYGWLLQYIPLCSVMVLVTVPIFKASPPAVAGTSPLVLLLLLLLVSEPATIDRLK